MTQSLLKRRSGLAPAARRQVRPGRYMSVLPSSFFYEFQLNGPTPDRVRIKLEDPFTPCDRRFARLKQRIIGTALAQKAGEPPERQGYRIPGPTGQRAQNRKVEYAFETISSQSVLDLGRINHDANERRDPLARKVSSDFWAHPDISDPDFFDLQAFEWLRDAAAWAEKPHFVWSLINAWMTENARYRPVTWSPPLTAMRLINIIHYSDYVLKKSGPLFRSRLLSSMARQARHLARSSAKLTTPIERLVVPVAICLCGLAFPAHDALERQGRLLLKRELRLTVAHDGAHMSRNPSAQLRLALLLIGLRAAYQQRGRQVPSFLNQEINRMLGVVEFFRDSNGHLPVFNGGVEDDAKAIATAMRYYNRRKTPEKSRAIGAFIATGYQKMRSGRARVLVDMGAGRHMMDVRAKGKLTGAVRAASGGMAYDSAASFQFSYAGQQIVTNCGTVVPGNLAAMSCGPLTEAQAAFTRARAHSRLSIDPAHAAGSGADRRPPVFSYFEEDHGRLVEIEQVILTKSGALPYKRRLFLHIDGHDFRGEESLSGALCDMPHRFCAIRFHLHPTVTACLSRDKRSVIITTASQTGWRFSSNIDGLALEESIHACADGRHQRNRQIVLSPDISSFNNTPVKWRFARQ